MSQTAEEQVSPFHRGELAVQERLGVRDRVAVFGQRALRDFMPDQHRDFYAQLSFLVIGAVDESGRPWASIIPGQPGFLSSPNARQLDVAASPLYGDPALHRLPDGADVGVLGIELETRRRNRMNGRIGNRSEDGFTIHVDQAFGNCPQYIQTRTVEVLTDVNETGRPKPVRRAGHFDRSTVDLIENADTLFIATAFGNGQGGGNQGADVSHRGGKPGFVRVLGEKAFAFPDFPGNRFFNTLGNLEINPNAGILLPDFETGDLVYMTGQAEVVWGGEDVLAFEGAERIVRFQAEEILHVENSLPFRFAFGDYSPALARTGHWSVPESAAAS